MWLRAKTKHTMVARAHTHTHTGVVNRRKKMVFGKIVAAFLCVVFLVSRVFLVHKIAFICSRVKDSHANEWRGIHNVHHQSDAMEFYGRSTRSLNITSSMRIVVLFCFYFVVQHPVEKSRAIIDARKLSLTHDVSSSLYVVNRIRNLDGSPKIWLGIFFFLSSICTKQIAQFRSYGGYRVEDSVSIAIYV